MANQISKDDFLKAMKMSEAEFKLQYKNAKFYKDHFTFECTDPECSGGLHKFTYEELLNPVVEVVIVEVPRSFNLMSFLRDFKPFG